MQINSVTGQPIIRADRVTLRPLQQSDVGLLAMYAGDKRVARFTRSIPHPLPLCNHGFPPNSFQTSRRL